MTGSREAESRRQWRCPGDDEGALWNGSLRTWNRWYVDVILRPGRVSRPGTVGVYVLSCFRSSMPCIVEWRLHRWLPQLQRFSGVPTCIYMLKRLEAKGIPVVPQPLLAIYCRSMCIRQYVCYHFISLYFSSVIQNVGIIYMEFLKAYNTDRHFPDNSRNAFSFRSRYSSAV